MLLCMQHRSMAYLTLKRHPMHLHVSNSEAGVLPRLDPISDSTLFCAEQSSRKQKTEPERILALLYCNQQPFGETQQQSKPKIPTLFLPNAVAAAVLNCTCQMT